MSSNSERAVSRALRAQAGSVRPGAPGVSRPPPAPVKRFPVGWVLLIALLVGAVIGVSLALVSIFQPGLLPAWP
jgi:hypothetical protein